MCRRFWLTLVVIGAVLAVILATIYGYISAKDTSPVSLIHQLIQIDNLPEGATIPQEPHLVNNLPGPLSEATLPFQSTGFVMAANVDILYPVVLSNKEPGRVYIINMVYQFETPAQAQAVFQRQSEFVTRHNKPGVYEVTTVELAPLTTVDKGTFVCARYSLDNNDNRVPLGEGLDMETCSFFGVNDNVLTLLVLDGFYRADATSQKMLEALAAKLLEP